MTPRGGRGIIGRLAPWASMAVLALSTTGVGAAAELGLITGSKTGTYFRVGEDLRRVVRSSGIDVVVHPSKGAVDNLFAVSRRGRIHLGIVQSDVLAFVADRHADPAVARIAGRIALVFPLFDEEVHVLGRRDIGDFAQLAGKRVAIGREGTGTYLTARWLFQLAGVAPREMVPLDAGEALAQLKAGRIDALVYVAAAPIGMLQRQLKDDDGLALVPIGTSRIRDAYAGAEIPAGTYAWQPTPVATVAVKAVLVSAELDAQGCELIGRFAQAVSAGRDWLVQHGHPAWKHVDLEHPIVGWEQPDCVRDHVRATPATDSPAAGTTATDSPPAGPITERNPVADAIKDALDRR